VANAVTIATGPPRRRDALKTAVIITEMNT
jgi:hypothetical protein